MMADITVAYFVKKIIYFSSERLGLAWFFVLFLKNVHIFVSIMILM